ncbi:MAG: hypothetical protein IJK73_06965 [Bacteroidales bacterium]|nr:hypothetical protein [Bacteroidales bacterium]
MLHFGVCFLIALLLFPVIGWWSLGTATMVGVLKELYDLKDYGLFSWWDIVADLVGVGVGVILLTIIKIII